MITRRSLSVAAVVLAAVALTGCGGATDGPFDSGEPAVDDFEIDGLVAESVRLMGEDESGNRYYAARAERDDRNDQCFIVSVPDTAEPTMACSNMLPISVEVRTSEGMVSATLHPVPVDSASVGPWVTTP